MKLSTRIDQQKENSLKKKVTNSVLGLRNTGTFVTSLTRVGEKSEVFLKRIKESHNSFLKRVRPKQKKSQTYLKNIVY